MTMQRLDIAGIHRVRETPASHPTYIAGQRIYAIGSMGGGIIAVGDEHLVGAMGGVWAHPCRVLAGWQLSVATGAGQNVLNDADECVMGWSHLERRWETAQGLPVRWCEWVAENRPAIYVELSIENPLEGEWRGTLTLEAAFDLQPCWFGGVEVGPTTLRAAASQAQATTADWESGWGAALGSAPDPERITLHGASAQLHYSLQLAPGQSHTILAALVCDHGAGAVGAAADLRDALLLGGYRLAERQATYDRTLSEGVTLRTPDKALNEAWMLSKLNLLALEADYPPALGRYFLAGIPEYPQLFGCDTTYTVPGALAAGFVDTTLSALRELAQVAWRQCGRVPHELTTNGRIFNPGNVQETPQFALAVWDAVRWTGDLAMLRELYPICREGMRAYLMAGHGRQDSPYLWGDGMVERFGMGVFKLDVQCYAMSGLYALAEMAERLGRSSEAADHRQTAEAMRLAFEADWWLPDEGMYADSRHSDGRNQLDGHWTVMLPVQLGLAAPDRAARVLERVMAEWVNEWGLVHTRGREDRVWTLPTGLLALALFRHGRPDDGLRLLGSIASTANAGLLGALEELIPHGLCFVQLWSAGLLIEGVVAGLLGVRPDALANLVALDPHLPDGWGEVRLDDLRIGAHRINLTIANQWARVEHLAGDVPLGVEWRSKDQRQVIIPGEIATLGDDGR
jgi:hypothetical protein